MSFTVTPEIQQIKTQFRELHNRRNCRTGLHEARIDHNRFKRCR
jgi:hypothetical protein